MSRWGAVPFRRIQTFAIEGGLILGVTYLLANLTLTLDPQVTPAQVSAPVLFTSLAFGIGFIGTSLAPISKSTPRLGTWALMGVSLGLGAFCFLVCWNLPGPSRRFPSLLVLESALALPLVIITWRWISYRLQVFEASPRRLLVIGTGEIACEIVRAISESRSADYVILGFVDKDRSRIGQRLAMGKRILTDFASLAQDVHALGVNQIVVALDEKRGITPMRELVNLRVNGVKIEDATSFLERTTGKIAMESMLLSWLVFSDGFKYGGWRTLAKRATDIVFSLALLILAAPLMALTSLLIYLDTPGPVLYRQRRMGRFGEEFDLLKFRSMVQDAEDATGPTWARENDKRTTRVGRIIRRLRIDELPQLFNVLRGKMSFVGPRPERRHFVQRLENEMPHYALRMTIRPGITGWAQVRYRYGATIEDAREKLKYDLYYVKNSNILLDFLIALKTIRVVLSGNGAR